MDDTPAAWLLDTLLQNFLSTGNSKLLECLQVCVCVCVYVCVCVCFSLQRDLRSEKFGNWRRLVVVTVKLCPPPPPWKKYSGTLLTVRCGWNMAISRKFLPSPGMESWTVATPTTNWNIPPRKKKRCCHALHTNLILKKAVHPTSCSACGTSS